VSAQDDRVSTDALKHAAASGVRWSFVATITNQLGRIGSTIVLARLVGPRNFGIVSQANIYLTFVVLLMNQGFGVALIQKRRLDDEDVASVYALNIVLATVITGLTILVAPAVSLLFDSPELTTVLRVMCVSIFVNGIAVVPTSLINRALRFKQLAAVQITSVTIGATASIVAAALGADYWALVVQVVTFDVTTLAGLILLTGIPNLRIASVGRLRQMMRFSTFLMGAQVMGFFGSNLDNVLIAARLSERKLAFYAVSYRFLQIPNQLLGSIVNRVALPVFARAQDDMRTVRSWFIASTRVAGAVLFPAFTLLAVGAPDGVILVFGERWRPAIVPMQLLALAGFSRSIRLLLAPLSQALGRTDINFTWAAATLSAALPGYLIGLHWGINGVAAAVAIISVVMGTGHVLYAGRLIDVGIVDYGKVIAPLAFCALTLAGVWAGVRTMLEAAGAPTLVMLAGATLVGLAAYATAMLLAAPKTVAAVRQTLTLLRAKA
jgi:O-antigen/teichoic acid export membrane protein